MNIAQQLEQTIKFLQEQRKGYKYHIKISVKNDQWLCSVVGESMEDKSYPHDFVQCQTSDFNQLPALVKNKAAELLKLEVERNKLSMQNLMQTNERLMEEYQRLDQLKL